MTSSGREPSVAARRLATIGQLAGALAHDFNNHLTAILGYAELLLDDLSRDDPRRADLIEIQRSGERAARLTRQLLAFRRNADAPPQLLSWAVLLRELQPLLVAAAGDRVAVDLPAGDVREIPLQKADASHVAFAAVLLARVAMLGGGRCVFAAADAAGEGVVLTVTLEPAAGSRPGDLPPDVLIDLEQLVTASGGRLVVESAWPDGIRFAATYQALFDEQAPPEPPANLPLAVEAVVVEDEPTLRDLIRRMLEHHGFAVRQAADAADALALFRAPGPAVDVLITDIVMPGPSGVALARELMASHPGLAVLFISGYVDALTVELSGLGFPCAFLAKPFTPEQLIVALRAALAGRAPRVAS